MANTLTVLIPKLLAGVVSTLRQNAITAALVNRQYSLDPQARGNTITIPVPASQTAATVTPANSFPANTDNTPTSVTVTLDKWYNTKFHLSDQEMTQIASNDNFVPGQLAEAVKALTNQVDGDILALYKDIYSAAGTAATTPFASDATAWTTGARKLLNQTLAPMSGRNVVLDPAAEANAINLQAFQSAAWRGDGGGAIRDGEIGRVLGADWFMNQNIPSFTGGTLSDGTNKKALVNDASYTVGESTVDIDSTTLTGTVVIGDVFTVAGDTQQYVVTANATAASNAIAGMAFKPASKVAWADNAAVTFVANHVANLAFHPNAFALATAPLQDAITDGLGQEFGVVQDPISGLVFRLTVARQYYQTTWYLDTLYGVKTVREELASRIMG